MIIVIEGGDQAGKKTQTILLAKALKKRKIKADYVISGIPFSFFPEKYSMDLIDTTKNVLKKNGIFLIYQATRKFQKYLEGKFEIIKKDFSILNIPPLWIFSTKKK